MSQHSQADRRLHQEALLRQAYVHDLLVANTPGSKNPPPAGSGERPNGRRQGRSDCPTAFRRFFVKFRGRRGPPQQAADKKALAVRFFFEQPRLKQNLLSATAPADDCSERQSKTAQDSRHRFRHRASEINEVLRTHRRIGRGLGRVGMEDVPG